MTARSIYHYPVCVNTPLRLIYIGEVLMLHITDFLADISISSHSFTCLGPRPVLYLHWVTQIHGSLTEGEGAGSVQLTSLY